MLFANSLLLLLAHLVRNRFKIKIVRRFFRLIKGEIKKLLCFIIISDLQKGFYFQMLRFSLFENLLNNVQVSFAILII